MHIFVGFRLRAGPRYLFPTALDHRLDPALGMPPLPKQYAPFVYGIIQAAISTAVATAVATRQSTGFGLLFLERWTLAWLVAFLTMLPVVIFVAPLIQRAVSALTAADTADTSRERASRG